jgi:hypothetical protein
MIRFRENALTARDRELAARFEREIIEAAGTAAQAECRIQTEGADPRAPDRARVVLLQGDSVIEWTVALPVAPGDVSRAARRALTGRRPSGERRRLGRRNLDRRRS